MRLPRLCLVLILGSLFSALSVLASDVSGQWTWTMQNPRGPQEARATFTVKDGVLTGTVAGRLGEAPIEQASIDGDKIAFTLRRALADGQDVVIKFKGAHDGNVITGTLERSPANEYDAPVILDWKATRQKP